MGFAQTKYINLGENLFRFSNQTHTGYFKHAVIHQFVQITTHRLFNEYHLFCKRKCIKKMNRVHGRHWVTLPVPKHRSGMCKGTILSCSKLRRPENINLFIIFVFIFFLPLGNSAAGFGLQAVPGRYTPGILHIFSVLCPFLYCVCYVWLYC